MKCFIILLLTFLIGNWVNAQNEIFSDNFDDNRNNWPLEIKEFGESKIVNGKLIISHQNENGTNWINMGVFFDPEEDFEVEWSQRQTAGDDNSSTGLVFGISDSENFFAFSITATQYFVIQNIITNLIATYIKERTYWFETKY